LGSHLNQFEFPVMVAMSAVRMVEMAGNQIVDVIAVRDGLMPAVGPVLMAGLVSLAFVARGTVLRIRRAHRNHVFIVVVIMVMVQMSIVQVIDVILVLNPGVAASWSVNVDVVASGVHLVRHDVSLLPFFQIR
jgi:hypothetical protein